ncbi:Glutathione S-transferase zeta-1 [Lunasporangiospora selenospora]|uniref:Glutathione S-transferase zeta-1 n=1 Tax=Lunasporangiospora selenospora TaxID=979761 RepID=A0A9P6FX45_9FUNG|nr:Glutathione S-transferase zeta-1 [Lunasporangiospora selenospora]
MSSEQQALDRPILYSYFRSSCSYRVRIALNLKKIDYEVRPINLLKNEQKSADYLKINPLGFVPAYIDSKTGETLTESISILEYLEEAYPEAYPLLPKDPIQKAKVRALVGAIAMGIQPITNLKILKYVGSQKDDWAKAFIMEGFRGFEAMLRKTAGTYCFGDTITMADVALIPQAYNGMRFGCDFGDFPIIMRVVDKLNESPEFRAAHPTFQIDCPADPPK